jgi:radical SAM superfamily enzyme YgiQ (UPF0313 family)
MIDICFVVTPIPELKDDQLEPPLGYLYLATYLKQFGYDVRIVDLCGMDNWDALWDIPQAKYYGFSTYSTNYHRALDIKNKIKAIYPNAKFIAGGAHASAVPEEVRKDFDYVVTQEGELTLKRILDKELQPGIYIGEFIPDLDSIPFPDYSLVNINEYHRMIDGKKCFSVLSSRGCPHKCIYCNSVIMGGHKRVRFREPFNVMWEISNLQMRYGDVSFRFQDDLFASNESWLKEFTKLIKPLNIEYRAFARVTQCCDKGHVELLKSGGCRHLAFGVESGSDEILSRMKKNQTVKQIKTGIKNVRDAGILTRIYLIVGFPGETWETVKETMDLVKEIQPDEYVVYPLIPYLGSEILAKAEEYGLRNIDKDYSKYFQIKGAEESEFVYDLDYADRDELQAMKMFLISRINEFSKKAIDSVVVK